MTSDDTVTRIPVPSTNSDDPKLFCSKQCTASSKNFFVLKQNTSCSCLDKIPQGGKAQLISLWQCH